MPTTMRTVVSEPIVRPERHVVAAYTAVIDGGVWVATASFGYDAVKSPRASKQTSHNPGNGTRIPGKQWRRFVIARLRHDDYNAAHPAWCEPGHEVTGWQRTSYQQLTRVFDRDAQTLRVPSVEGPTIDDLGSTVDAAEIAMLRDRLVHDGATMLHMAPAHSVDQALAHARIAYKTWVGSRWELFRITEGEVRMVNSYSIAHWQTGLPTDAPSVTCDARTLMTFTEPMYTPVRWGVMAPRDGYPPYLVSQIKLGGCDEAYVCVPVYPDPMHGHQYEDRYFNMRETLMGTDLLYGVVTVNEIKPAIATRGLPPDKMTGTHAGRYAKPMMVSYGSKISHRQWRCRVDKMDDYYKADWQIARPDDIARVPVNTELIAPLTMRRSVMTPIEIMTSATNAGRSPVLLRVAALSGAVAPASEIVLMPMILTKGVTTHWGMRPADGWPPLE